MKKAAIIMIIALLVLGAFGTQTAWSQKATNINIASAAMGGVYYPTAVAIAKLLNDKMVNVKATVMVTGGSAKNMDILSQKEAEIGYTSGLIANYAARGTDIFKGRDMSWLRGLSSIWPDVFQIVVTPDIKSLMDLKGKRVAVGAVGSAVFTDARMIFGALGLELGKDIQPEHVGFAESADLLRDKHIKASLMLGMPHATVIDLMSMGGFKILNLTKEEVGKIRAKEPIFTDFMIPANYYKNQPNAIQTLSIPNFLFVRADWDPNVVYQVTKTIFENMGELIKAHKAFEDMSLQNAVKGMPFQPNDGAARYYREKGVIK